MAFPTFAESSRQDANQNLSITVLQGTQGTATPAATLPMPVTGDPVTGAMYTEILGTVTTQGGGTTPVSGTVVVSNIITGTIASDNIVSGTQQTLGTVGVVNNIAGGTLNAGTVTASLTSSGTILNLASGTLAAVTSVTNLAAGTITSLLSQSAGTLNTLGTAGVVNNIVTGTLAAVTTVTTVSNLTNGSVVMTNGTITTGTVQNLVTGTINALASGTITAGTFAMTAGTLSPLPTIANATFGTIGTTGVSVFGTLAGGTSSGAGTEIFITSLSLSIPSTAGSQDVSIGWGTNGGTFQAGTGRLVRGNFLAGGGIQKTFWPPVNSGTNAQLTYFQAGAGTVEIDITYFVTASTL